jgi:hypothetical protein
MSLVRLVAKSCLTLLMLLPLALPAEAGTFAQSIRNATLRLGPGLNYPTAGDLGAKHEVEVQSCRFRWCLVVAGSAKGWVSVDDLSFGTEAKPELFAGPKLDLVLGGSGTVCFYSGQNFSGTSICSKTGRVVPDLALHGIDNSFRSIEIVGAVSVHVCSDYAFGAYCTQVNESKPTLDRFLDRSISSYRVW